MAEINLSTTNKITWPNKQETTLQSRNENFKSHKMSLYIIQLLVVSEGHCFNYRSSLDYEIEKY